MQTTSKVRKQTISDGYLRGNVPTLNSGPADSKGTCWTKYFWRNRSGSFSLSSKLSLKGILRLAVVYKNKIIASFNFSYPWLHLLFFLFFLINISFKDIFFTDQFGREREYILSTEVESGHCMAKLYWLHDQARSRGRGRGGSSPPRNFQTWIKFCFKSGIFLLKWTTVNGN